MWELTRETARNLVDLYGKGDVTDLDTRLRRIINEAIGAGLERDHVEEQVQSWNTQLAQRKRNWSNVNLALADLRLLLLASRPTGANSGTRCKGLPAGYSITTWLSPA